MRAKTEIEQCSSSGDPHYYTLKPANSFGKLVFDFDLFSCHFFYPLKKLMLLDKWTIILNYRLLVFPT